MPWRDFDYPLLIVTLLLIGLGLIMISSTTEGALALRGPALRQAMTAAIGLSLMVVLAVVDYRVLGHLRNVIYEKRVKDPQIIIAMKVDKEAPMGLVSEVQEEMRKANALRVNYSAIPGAF